MRLQLRPVLGLILTLVFCLAPLEVNGASGMPGCAKFGYGARLNIYGSQLENIIRIAEKLDLDWVAMDYDWAKLWPDGTISPTWDILDGAMNLVGNRGLAVMLSITNPPAWALDLNGPDPDLTARIVMDLATRYRGTLLAFELFPAANTAKGWGRNPNPQAYALLLKTVVRALQSLGTEVTIVAAGLEPNTQPGKDMNDILFLDAVYKAGVADSIPVVGLRLPNISIIPTEAPDESKPLALRHYEVIRETMLRNNHQSGLIWITGFSWDSQAITSSEGQATWLKQAFLMMRAQLYIGNAFFQNLNPGLGPDTNDLISKNDSLHPGIEIIRQLIALENSQHVETFVLKVLKSSPNPLSKND
jgi:hypothetical protein